MTAFVLGATGFVGREVVRQLCVRGGKPIAHVRPDSKKLDEWKQTFAELGAETDHTAWDATALGTTLREKRVTELYILIGTTKSKAKSDQVAGNIYEAVDLGLTKIALEAAKQAGKPRVIYLSSIGADPNARSAYLKARGQTEELVKSSGLPWVIARPSLIVGDRDELRLGEKIGAGIGDSVLSIAGVFGAKRARARYRSTRPDVLASALIRIGEASEHDKVFDGDDLR